MPRHAWIAPLSAALAALIVGAPAAAVRSPASNQRAARRDAATHVNALSLPPQARTSPTRPRGDRGALEPPLTLVATRVRADSYAWWKTPETTGAVLNYVEGHPPAGATQSGTGSSCSRSACSRSVIYGWPAIPGVIAFRELVVTVAPLSGGGTGVLAFAQSDWIVPRSASEQLPAGVRAVEITSRKPGGPVTSSLTVTERGQVRRIVALFDAMPIAQPVAVACPALWVGAKTRRITFWFWTRTGGTLLAQASYTDYAPDLERSGQCNPIAFRIRDHRQPALIGGDFLKRVEGIAGRHVAG